MEYQELRDAIMDLPNSKYAKKDWKHEDFADIILKILADKGMGFQVKCEHTQFCLYDAYVDCEAGAKGNDCKTFVSLSDLIK